MIKPLDEIEKHFDHILNIYKVVEWTVYTSKPEKLKVALNNSSYVFGFFDGNNLLGLIRGLTDKVSINYIQDILVLPSEQDKGIGTKLVSHIFNLHSNVRTQILLTDDDPSQLAFYKKLSMENTKEIKEFTLNVFVKFKD